jgi:hypothetical protein
MEPSAFTSELGSAPRRRAASAAPVLPGAREGLGRHHRRGPGSIGRPIGTVGVFTSVAIRVTSGYKNKMEPNLIKYLKNLHASRCRTPSEQHRAAGGPDG